MSRKFTYGGRKSRRAEIKQRAEKAHKVDEQRWVRYPEAVEAAEKAKSMMPADGILIGVEWHGACQNGVYANLDALRKDIASIQETAASAIGAKSREAARDWVLGCLRHDRHVENEDEGWLVIATVAWLMATSEAAIVEHIEKNPTAREWRYLVTTIGKDTYNWRLIALVPVEEPKG